MNEIITLEVLAERLAQRTGIIVLQARQAIVDLQNSISDKLLKPEGTASIDGLGTFTVTDKSTGHISFTPSLKLAEDVNEPFSCFEPLELEPDVIIDDSTDTEIETEIEGGNATEEAVMPPDLSNTPDNSNLSATVVDTQAVNNETVDTEVVDNAKAINNAEAVDNAEVVDTDTVDYDTTDTEAIDDTEPVDNTKVVETIANGKEKSHSLLIGFILGLLTGMIITCIAVYFMYPSLSDFDQDDNYDYETTLIEETTESQPQPVEPTETPDTQLESKSQSLSTTAVEPPTDNTPKNTTANKVITDTVAKRYYLATMSRKYYGRMDFWVYIYKENEAKLGHPDRIPPGTVVTIPPASKYNINANDQASIDRARALNREIYSRFE